LDYIEANKNYWTHHDSIAEEPDFDDSVNKFFLK